MKQLFVLAMMLGAFALPAFAADAEQRPDVEAITAAGEKVQLYPNGRWEFADVQKKTEAKKIADQNPENKGCPPGWQGGLLMGYGRCIPPGHKDYNRGSLGRR